VDAVSVDGGVSRRATTLVIDLAAVRANVGLVRRRLAPRTKLWAVVKANAYGHGAVAVGRTVLEAGADGLAVALPEEGAELRAAGIRAPILVLSPVLPHQAPAVAAADLEPIVFRPAHIEALAQAAERCGRLVRVHLKVDTGMGRVGAAVQDAATLARQITRRRSLQWAGLLTHMASADEDPAFTEEQYQMMLETVEELRRAGLEAPVHMANSAAALRFPGLQADAVRVGLALYGLSPYPGAAGPAPALSLQSVATMVKTVPAGFPVGYGRTYRAPVPLQIVTVAAGYADGVRRALSNRGEAVVAGCRVPIVGRISMDQLTLGVPREIPVAEGDPVTLIGRQGEAEVTVEDWAQILDTISYEVVCGFGPRVPRHYVNAPIDPSRADDGRKPCSC